MRTLMLTLIATLTLAACAAAPQPATPIDWQAEKAHIPPGMALLYVVRPQKPAGRDNLYRIGLNGVLVDDMPTGTYFQRTVQAGEVRVKAQAVPSVTNIRSGLPFLERPELTVRTTAGEISFVRVGVGIEGGPTLANVNPAEGEVLAEHAKELAPTDSP